MAGSLWLLAIFALTCGSHFAASVGVPNEKSPVRRSSPKVVVSPKEEDSDSQEDEQEFSGANDDMTCVVWGEAHPSGHKKGTTKLNGQHFATKEEAEEHFIKSKAQGADVVIQYQGNLEMKRYISSQMDNGVRWRTLFEWCKRTDRLEGPEKYHPVAFMLAPISPPVRKQNPPVVPQSFALKQKDQLAANDEDEGPAAAYSDELDKDKDMHCIILGDTRGEGKTKLNGTVFENKEDADQHFKQAKSLGMSLVVHYEGKREYKRYVAPVVTHVPWVSLLDWCRQMHATQKARPKGSYFATGVAQAQREVGSFINKESVQVPAHEDGISMAESAAEAAVQTAETVQAFKSAEFAPMSTYDQVQKLMGQGMTRQVVSYKRYQDWNCQLENSSDARMTGVDMSVSACKESCDKDLQCNCLQYDRTLGACYTSRLAHCHEKKCARSQTSSVYFQRAQWATDTENILKYEGKACAVTVSGNTVGRGGNVRGTEKAVLSHGACQKTCAQDHLCTCFNYNRVAKTCTTMRNCHIGQCEDSEDDDMYLHKAQSGQNVLAHNEGKPW